jgi:hypothetical protein
MSVRISARKIFMAFVKEKGSKWEVMVNGQGVLEKFFPFMIYFMPSCS